MNNEKTENHTHKSLTADNLFYRFRSMKQLLGEKDELAKTEMFFSPIHLLNDPLDGKLKVYWKGNSERWKGLIYNYALNLFEKIIYLYCGNLVNFTKINVTGHRENLPYKNILRKEIMIFFETETGKGILNDLSKHNKIYKENLVLYFILFLHKKILKLILELYLLENEISQPPYNSIMDFITKSEYDSPNSGDILLKQPKEIWDLMQVHIDFIFSEISQKNNDDKILFVISGFVEKYFETLEESTYFKWGVVSLTKSYSQQLLWANYADSHKGACLIFEINEKERERLLMDFFEDTEKVKDNLVISLGRITFEKIQYKNLIPQINFFEAMGTFSKGAGDDFFSFCKKVDNPYSDKNYFKWHKNYLKVYDKCLFQKTTSWKYENEYRMVLSGLHDRFGKDGVKLRYKFCKLKGIIFGVKTSYDDKIQTINILKKLCKEKEINNFAFYQAIYDQEENTIKAIPLMVKLMDIIKKGNNKE